MRGMRSKFVMLGENHELKNRYMLIGNDNSGEPHTSSHTSLDDLISTLSDNVKRLIKAVGSEELIISASLMRLWKSPF